MDRQEFINYCENSKWANDWFSGIEGFFNAQASSEAATKAKRNACKSRANDLNFPVSDRMANYMLGGKKK